MKTIAALLFPYFCLTSAFAQTAVEGTSIVVVDAKTGAPRGSATHICSPDTLSDTTGRSYFLTAAHVVDLANGLATAPGKNLLSVNGQTLLIPVASQPLKVVRIDSSRDIALLTQENTALGAFSSGVGCLSVPALVRPLTPTVYDILATQGLAVHHLALEAFDAPTGTLRRLEFTAKMASSRSSGLPGREGTGPLVMLSASGIQGYSGGAVTEEQPSPLADIPGERTLVGMVLAVDLAGQQMALLSQASIAQFLYGEGLRSRHLEKEVTGGVLYTDSSFVHFRAGTTRLAATRTLSSRPGGWIDAGPGNLADGGPGNLSDGGSLAHAKALYTSGLVELARPQRRWLSLGNWSEAEPFPLARREELNHPELLQGLYAENGQLFLTSKSADLPVFLQLDDPQNCQKVFASQNSAPGKTVPVILCQVQTDQQRIFALALTTGRKQIVFRVSLDVLDSTSKPLPVRLEARAMNMSRGRLTANELRTIALEKDENGEALTADGVRTFTGSRYWLHVEQNGGFEIQLKTAAGLESFSGPLVKFQGATP